LPFFAAFIKITLQIFVKTAAKGVISAIFLRKIQITMIINRCPNCCGADMENGVCPACGYIAGSEASAEQTLPYGTVLQDRYFVGRVLGQGGFGITYLGFDLRLQIKIAVKEYYPSGYVSRQLSDHTYSIRPFAGDKAAFVEKELQRFLKEANRLSKFVDSPGIVNVRDVFKDKNTAYIVMGYVDGKSLKEVLDFTGGKMRAASTLEMFQPIIETLGKMHADNIIHRDISPDNIMVQLNGSAKLIDFGASIEQVEGSGNKPTTALIRSGYSPEELYDPDHSRQGTWSDVYSICATMFRTITGEPPPDAYARLRGAPLAEMDESVPPRVKAAILHGLEINAKNRIQTMEELANELFGIVNETPIQISTPTPIPIPTPISVPTPNTTALPAPKFVKYIPDSFVKLKYAPKTLSPGNGRVVSYTHELKGRPAGFYVDFTPKQYLHIGYTNDNYIFQGVGEQVRIDLTSGVKYGITYIGQTFDKDFSGEAYFFRNFRDRSFSWSSFRGGKNCGIIYWFDGVDFFIRNYESGSSVPPTKPLRETTESGDMWRLDNNNALVFRNSDLYSGFAAGNQATYFGIQQSEGGDYYRGQFIGGIREGMGIVSLKDSSLYIGQFRGGNPDGFGMTVTPDGKVFLSRIDKGKWKHIAKLKGIAIDQNIF
jgi:serine/threonine protein kinase